MPANEVQDRAPDYLRLVFNQVPGAIWATDRELRFTYVHGRTGYLDDARAEELVGDSVYHFVGTEDPSEPAIAHHLAALAGKRQSFQYKRHDRLYEVLIEPLRDEGAVIVGCVGAAIDVTERREAQDKLTRSQAQLAEAQRVAHIGSFEWERAADRMTWSEELCRIYGVSPDRPPVTLDEFIERIHPEDRPRMREVLFKAIRETKPFEVEYRIVRPNGEIRTLRIAGDVVVRTNGAVLCIVASCWDITTQQDTMLKLRRSVSLLQATLDATADGILVVDRAGHVATHNVRFLDLWRIPKSVAARGDDQALLTFVADQLVDGDAFLSGVRNVYVSPTQTSFDVLRFKDGRVYERYSTPQLVDGAVVGRVWSFRDVSQRERLLQRATFLADATQLLESLDVEKAMGELARLAVPFLGDQCVIDLLRNGSPRRIRGAQASALDPEVHAAALAGNTATYTVGGRAHLAVPLTCRDEVTGVITLVAQQKRGYRERDVELLQELAQRISLSLDNARLYQGARDALASRDEFLSIAAHEIRGPVTSIHLASQALLRDSLSSGAAKTALDVIQREDRRLGRFVDDLLDLGRLRTGQLHLTLEPVDLGTVVRDVVSRMAGEAKEAGSAVSVTTDGELVGEWDRMRLEQVVTNLLSNALKFGRGKPVAISARGAGGRVTVAVTDHGIGIEPAMLTRIFDRFERAVGARNYGGLGLGLHISKTIVDSLGGTLTVDSQPGEGATFTMELPAARSSRNDETANPRSR